MMKELEPVIDTLSKGLYYDMSKLPPPPATTALLNEDPIYSQLTAVPRKSPFAPKSKLLRFI